MQTKGLEGYSRFIALVLAYLAHLGMAPATPAQAPVETPHNYAPGIVVLSPVSDNTQNHLRLSATLMVTGSLPDSMVLAVAILPTGERLTLREFPAEACFVQYSYDQPGPFPKSLTKDSCSPASYPLTGFGLPVASLPVGAIVEVTVMPIRREATQVRPFRIRTTSSIRGIEQSANRLQMTIAGVFQPGLPAYVYFGLWPVPIRPEAATVLPGQIAVDLSKDQAARRWATDLYPITVYQQDLVCDTVLVRFQSPLDVKHESSSMH